MTKKLITHITRENVIKGTTEEPPVSLKPEFAGQMWLGSTGKLFVGDITTNKWIPNTNDSELNAVYEHVKDDLATKRDKSTKISRDDLDTSQDSKKIGLVNLSDEVKKAMTGQTPVAPSIPNKSLVSEYYADESVNSYHLSKQAQDTLINLQMATSSINKLKITDIDLANSPYVKKCVHEKTNTVIDNGFNLTLTKTFESFTTNFPYVKFKNSPNVLEFTYSEAIGFHIGNTVGGNSGYVFLSGSSYIVGNMFEQNNSYKVISSVSETESFVGKTFRIIVYPHKAEVWKLSGNKEFIRVMEINMSKYPTLEASEGFKLTGIFTSSNNFSSKNFLLGRGYKEYHTIEDLTSNMGIALRSNLVTIDYSVLHSSGFPTITIKPGLQVQLPNTCITGINNDTTQIKYVDTMTHTSTLVVVRYAYGENTLYVHGHNHYFDPTIPNCILLYIYEGKVFGPNGYLIDRLIDAEGKMIQDFNKHQKIDSSQLRFVPVTNIDMNGINACTSFKGFFNVDVEYTNTTDTKRITLTANPKLGLGSSSTCGFVITHNNVMVTITVPSIMSVDFTDITTSGAILLMDKNGNLEMCAFQSGAIKPKNMTEGYILGYFIGRNFTPLCDRLVNTITINGLLKDSQYEKEVTSVNRQPITLKDLYTEFPLELTQNSDGFILPNPQQTLGWIPYVLPKNITEMEFKLERDYCWVIIGGDSHVGGSCVAVNVDSKHFGQVAEFRNINANFTILQYGTSFTALKDLTVPHMGDWIKISYDVHLDQINISKKSYENAEYKHILGVSRQQLKSKTLYGGFDELRLGFACSNLSPYITQPLLKTGYMTSSDVVQAKHIEDSSNFFLEEGKVTLKDLRYYGNYITEGGGIHTTNEFYSSAFIHSEATYMDVEIKSEKEHFIHLCGNNDFNALYVGMKVNQNVITVIGKPTTVDNFELIYHRAKEEDKAIIDSLSTYRLALGDTLRFTKHPSQKGFKVYVKKNGENTFVEYFDILESTFPKIPKEYWDYPTRFGVYTKSYTPPYHISCDKVKVDLPSKINSMYQGSSITNLTGKNKKPITIDCTHEDGISVQFEGRLLFLNSKGHYLHVNDCSNLSFVKPVDSKTKAHTLYYDFDRKVMDLVSYPNPIPHSNVGVICTWYEGFEAIQGSVELIKSFTKSNGTIWKVAEANIPNFGLQPILSMNYLDGLILQKDVIDVTFEQNQATYHFAPFQLQLNGKCYSSSSKETTIVYPKSAQSVLTTMYYTPTALEGSEHFVIKRYDEAPPSDDRQWFILGHIYGGEYFGENLKAIKFIKKTDGTLVDLGKGSNENKFTTSSHRLLLPPKLFIVKEQGLPIYKSSIITHADSLNLLRVSMSNKGDGDIYRHRYFEEDLYLDGSVKGDVTFTLKQDKDHNVFMTHPSSIQVISKNDITNKNPNLILIGDSLTNRYQPYRVKTLLSRFGVNATMYGTMNNQGGESGEGREGWEYENYIGRDNTRGNGGEVIRLQTTFGKNTSNLNLNPFLKLATEEDKRNHPNWCFRNTGSERELSYAEDTDKTGNFYIFDFRHYLDRNGFPNPDVLTIGLSTNDIWQNGNAGVDHSIEALEIMLKQIKKAVPNIKIGVITPAWGSNSTGNNYWKNQVANWIERYQKLIRDLNLSNVHPVGVWCHMSKEHSFGLDSNKQYVNENSLCSVGNMGDYVHYSVAGQTCYANANSQFIANMLV